MKLSHVVLTACVVCSACDLGNGRACTEIAVASVSLEVVAAEDGEPIADAEVTFTLDGGESRQPDAHDDDVFVLDYEETGIFEVTVSAPGFETVTRTYDVMLDEDGCHPVGEVDEIELGAEE